MKISLFIICTLILAGCSSLKETTYNQAPVLLVQYPFPSIPASICSPDFMLVADLFIAADGSVSDVKLQNTSGSKQWDEIAITTIRTWKYSPLKIDYKPATCWVHQKMRVKMQEPVLFSLAGILCSSSEQADSAYKHLINGKSMTEVAKDYSALPVQGDQYEIGEVDIYQYPDFIRLKLLNLSEGEYTRPLKYDDSYVIFQCLKKM